MVKLPQKGESLCVLLTWLDALIAIQQKMERFPCIIANHNGEIKVLTWLDVNYSFIVIQQKYTVMRKTVYIKVSPAL